MKKDSLKYGIGGILIGGLVVWFLTISLISSNNTGMMQMMGLSRQASNNSSQMMTSNIDAHFIEQMIPHHEDAITMSKLAETKAQTSEVKMLAQNIIDSQSKEIKQMEDWHKEWFGKEVPKDGNVMEGHGMGHGSKMHMGMMGDETDVTGLEEAEDFDKAFVQDMIPHHQMAVMMANMLKVSTNRSEMKKLADDIITAQTKEINLMRSWLENW